MRARSSSTSRPAPSWVAILTLGALVAGVAGCNEILGVVPGQPATGGGGAGGIPSTGGQSAGGTGGSPSTGGTGGQGTGGTGGASPTGGGGQGGAGGCSLGTPPRAQGTPVRLRVPMSDGSDDGRGIAVDAEGNTLVVGSFNSAGLDFGGGELPYQGPFGYPDGNLFVAKYDPAGNHLYSRAFGGDEISIAEAVTTDAEGNVFVTGVMSGHVDFDGNMLYAPNDPGQYRNDAFVVKLSPTLEVLWAKNYGDNGWQQLGLDVAATAEGGVVVAGALFDEADFGAGIIGASGVWSTFLLALDASGATQWSMSFRDWAAITPNYYDYPSIGVAVAPDGDVVIASTIEGQAYFFEDLHSSVGEADAYVARIAGDGKSLRWLAGLHGAPQGGDPDGSQWAGPVAVDPCGDVLVGGAFTRSLSIGGEMVQVSKGDPLDPDGFVAKLAGGTGDVLWHRVFADAGRQEPHAIATDAWGNLVVTGALKDAAGYTGVDFGPGIGVLGPKAPPEPDYREDAFLVKYDASGDGQWGRRIGDPSQQIGYGVTTLPGGEVLWTGVFAGTIALGAGLSPASTDNYDVFTVWLEP